MPLDAPALSRSGAATGGDVRAHDLLARQAQMEDKRANWDSRADEIAERYFPQSEVFNKTRANNQRVGHRQWDSFPQHAAQRYPAVIEAGLTPRGQQWFTTTTGDEDLDDRLEIRRYREALAKRIYRGAYHVQANLTGALQDSYLQHGLFGLAGLFTEERRGGVRFIAPHCSQLYVAENQAGIVDTVHRKYPVDARQAVQKFGADAPTHAKEAVEQNKPYREVELVHAVMPRSEYDETRLGQNGMRYAEFYICPRSKRVIRERGYYEFPWAVVRSFTAPGEVYGRSPASIALSDTHMLNSIARVTLGAADKAIDPPKLVSAMFQGEVNWDAGTVVDGALDEQGRPMVVPWENRARIDLGAEMQSQVRNQIDDAFLGMFWRVLMDHPNMTATQALLIAQRQGQMAAPTIGRFERELLGPMIRRISGVLHRIGQAPEPPDALMQHLEAQGEPLGLDYESPLIRQARSEEGIGILRTFEALAPIAQVDPTVYDGINITKAARKLARVQGMPADCILSDEEVAAKQAERQAEADAAQLLEAAPVAAQTAKDIATAQATAGAAQPLPVEAG